MDDLSKSLMREMVREELASLLPEVVAEAVKGLVPAPAAPVQPDLTPLWAELDKRWTALDRRMAAHLDTLRPDLAPIWTEVDRRWSALETRTTKHLAGLRPEVPDLTPLQTALDRWKVDTAAVLTAELAQGMGSLRERNAGELAAMEGRIQVPEVDLTPLHDANRKHLAGLTGQVDALMAQTHKRLDALSSSTAARLAQVGPEIAAQVDAVADRAQADLDRHLTAAADLLLTLGSEAEQRVDTVLAGIEGRMAGMEQQAQLMGGEIEGRADAARSALHAQAADHLNATQAVLESRMAGLEGRAENLINGTESRVSDHLAALAVLQRKTL